MKKIVQFCEYVGSCSPEQNVPTVGGLSSYIYSLLAYLACRSTQLVQLLSVIIVVDIVIVGIIIIFVCV